MRRRFSGACFQPAPSGLRFPPRPARLRLVLDEMGYTASPVAFRSRLSAMEAPEAAGGPLFHDKDRSNSAPKVFTLLRVANGLARLLSAPSGLRFPRGRLAYPHGR